MQPKPNGHNVQEEIPAPVPMPLLKIRKENQYSTKQLNTVQ